MDLNGRFSIPVTQQSKDFPHHFDYDLSKIWFIIANKNHVSGYLTNTPVKVSLSYRIVR